jgi:predicted nuclease with TOPRIM domain
MDIEQAARENKLAELEILRQSLEEKNQRIRDLEKKAETLEDMLTKAASVRVQYPQPLPQRLPTAPRRWSVR